jgi:peroxiredoxin
MAERLIQAGTRVPPITAKRLGGGSETISYSASDRSTVLYIFTPQCVWCQRNLENLKTLIKEKHDEYRFIGISLTENALEGYVTENGLDIPVYAGVSAEAKTAYKMGSTPETIVVSPEGKVVQAWPGAYVDKSKSQVDSYFQVTLPGLTNDK